MIALATSEESDRRLPPSERAFEVYRLIEVDGLSTRAAAELVGLSQTRVVQLRNGVESYVAQQPTGIAGLTKQQRMQAAEYKAGVRLDHLYCLALEAFRQSQGPEVVSEDLSGGSRVVKPRMSQGNTRYLQMAMRIAAQQSRIPVTPIVAECCAEPSDIPASATAELNVACPPEEACSPAAVEPMTSAQAQRKQPSATAMPSTPLEGTAAEERGANLDFAADLFPVQTDVRVETGAPFEEPILTRKQRKRRARMLAELRKDIGRSDS